MNTEAIERIKGFCCEVDEEQWKELVMAAHDNGVNPSVEDQWHGCYPVFFIDSERNEIDGHAFIEAAQKKEIVSIPFPDFLAKLKGDEKWEPKAGEMVNGGLDNKHWSEFEDEYIAAYCGKHVVKHMTVRGEWIACVWDYVRPLRPTITRAEAEQLINKRIID
jgi:hypothetical protein